MAGLMVNVRIKLPWYQPALRRHPQSSAYLALACVCFFWGTTYLGIRIAVETIPPAVLMCSRYLISGGLMVAGALLMRAPLPRGRDLWLTALYGIVTVGGGTGALAFAEQRVPSGLAALFVTTSPFWLAGVEARVAGGEPLHGPSLRGLFVGLAGTAFLLAPDAWGMFSGTSSALRGRGILAGFLLLQFGSVAWAVGSIYQRRLVSGAHPFVSAAVQQLATGIAYTIPAAFQIRSVHWTPRGVGSVLYLAIFGGIVGYSAYVMAMERLPVSIASIYTYINPLVAVWLGWLFYREAIGIREGIAMAIIFLGVAIVKRASARRVVPSSVPVQELRAEGAAEGRKHGE